MFIPMTDSQATSPVYLPIRIYVKNQRNVGNIAPSLMDPMGAGDTNTIMSPHLNMRMSIR